VHTLERRGAVFDLGGPRGGGLQPRVTNIFQGDAPGSTSGRSSTSSSSEEPLIGGIGTFLPGPGSIAGGIRGPRKKGRPRKKPSTGGALGEDGEQDAPTVTPSPSRVGVDGSEGDDVKKVGGVGMLLHLLCC
jgi:hypothetical protein